MATGGIKEKNEACIDFQQLCKGQEKGYNFNVTSLEGITSKDVAVKKIIKQIDNTLADLQNGPKTLESFYVGKTSTRGMGQKGRPKKGEKSSENKYGNINPMDKETMYKTWICVRWGLHKQTGKDGMVIAAVITTEIAEAMGFRDDTDDDVKEKENKKQKSAALKCALDIEESVQKEYRKIHDKDYFKADDAYHEGSTAEKATAYPLYIAYEYLLPRSPSPMQQIQQKNPNAYYSFSLADLSTVDTVQKATEIIRRKIEDICADLRVSTRKEPKITLGHACVEKRAGYSTPSPTDPSTFDKKDIQDKFLIHKTEGSNGMFVVAVVTTEKATELKKEDALTCVKELEAELSQNQDWDTVKPNGSEKKGKTTVCLYFTFTLQVE